MSIQVLVGNSLEVLPSLEKDSVHCSVTSPPYYGLRKYDGDQQCDWPEVEYSPMPGLPSITVEPMTCALGHEPTIEAYVGHLVAIYREVWRVLRDDGVAWIVMGDSYSSQGGPEPAQTKWQVNGASDGQNEGRSRKTTSGFQPGDLMLVPHRLALALQADGWLVRNDDVWAKVAPMPESVAGWRWERHRVKVKGAPAGTRNVDNRNRQGDPAHSGGYRSDVANNPTAKWIDCPGCPKCEPNGGYVLKRGSWRHTRAHEFVFMLAKNMNYYVNQELVRENISHRPTTTIEFSNSSDQFSHFGLNGRFTFSDMRTRQICISHATTLLNLMQFKTNLGLPSLDSEIWKQLLKDVCGFSSIDLPTIERATAYASRFLGGYITTKIFLEQMDSLGIDLGNGDFFTISQSATVSTRRSDSDCDSPISINDPSEIGQRSFIHDTPPVPDYTTYASPLSSSGRNPRSVLSPSPEPFPGPHFAVFPTGLVEPLIKATCPDRCCPECGAGWSPVVERGYQTGGRQATTRTERGDSGKRYGDQGDEYQSSGGTFAQFENNILGYRPTCGCHAKDVNLLPDDLEVINTPIGTRVIEDPSMETGRAGYNRPRGPNEGTRPITRYEQRRYAEQLKNSTYRDKMEAEAGRAFAHYIRTDKSGARPAPEHLLENWIERGWIDRVFLPEFNPDPPHVPGVCLDPFFGAGTVGLVCDRLGLDCIGIDISESYAVDIAKERIVADAPLFADVAVREGI